MQFVLTTEKFEFFLINGGTLETFPILLTDCFASFAKQTKKNLCLLLDVLIEITEAGTGAPLKSRPDSPNFPKFSGKRTGLRMRSSMNFNVQNSFPLLRQKKSKKSTTGRKIEIKTLKQLKEKISILQKYHQRANTDLRIKGISN